MFGVVKSVFGRASRGARVVALGLAVLLAPVAAQAQTITGLSVTEGLSSATQTPADVTISGSGFSGSANQVFFGGVPAGIISESTNSITVTPPARGGGGLVDVAVTTAANSTATRVNGYRYLLPPTVSIAFSPSTVNGVEATRMTATISNPNPVELRGTGLVGATRPAAFSPVPNSFGGNCGGGFSGANFAMSGIWLAANASCTKSFEYQVITSGSYTYTTGNVFSDSTATHTTAGSVSLTGVTATTGTLVANAVPTLSSLSSSAGPLAGGQALTLTGTNFLNATDVTFDGASVSFTVNSNTSIATVIPAHAAGAVAVIVTTPGGTTTNRTYTYVAAPAANAQGVSTAYNTAVPVTLTGSGTGPLTYTVSSPPTHGSLSGSGASRTYTPTAGFSGVDTFEFTTTNPGGSSAPATVTVTVAAGPPVVSAISPAEGAADASTPPANVTITGTNFSASGNAVTFAGTPGTIVSESATSIVVTPPARGAGGLVNVVVTNANSQVGTAANAYRYLLPPLVTVSWSPSTVIGNQNTTFTLSLTNPNGVAINNVRVASNGANTPFTLTAFGGICGSGTYNASSSFTLTGFTLAANATCTVTSSQGTSSTGAYQFVTNAPTSTGTATTNVTLTGLPATSNTITAYQTPFISTASPNNGLLAGGTAITITGQRFYGATAVTIDGVPATNVTVVSDTSITATVPAGASAGAKTIAVTGPGGTGSRSSGYTYNALPAAPVISAPANGATVAGQPTYSGTRPSADAVVTVYVDGASIGTAIATGLNWSIQQPTALAGGSHTVTATSTTPVGGTSVQSATTTFTVDVTPPAQPTIVQPFPFEIKNRTPTLTGTAEVGGTVTVYANNTPIGTTTATGGAWSFTTTTLVDGNYSFRVTVTDAAGNVSPSSAAITIKIDNVAPAAATIGTPTNGLVTSGNPTYSGTGEPGSILELRFNGAAAVSGVQVAGDGAWSFTFPAAGLGNGTYVFSVIAADFAGNTAPETVGPTFTIDRTAPAVPVITSHTEGEFRQTRDAYIVGTAEPNAVVTVTGSYPQTLSADGSGNWSYIAPAVSADGPVSISVTATDAAGNVSTAATRSWTVDTVAPVAPVFTTPAEGQVVNQRNVSIMGTIEPYAHVNILLDGQPLAGFVTDASGTFSYTAPNVADGSHTLSARAADRANNAGAYSTNRNFTVDATAPAFPTLTSPTPNSTISNTTPTLSGAAETGAVVTIYLNDNFQGQVTAVGGVWTFPITAPLSDADYQVKLMALDPAFNSSGLSPAIPFRLDATAPLAPVILTPASGAQLTNSAVTITGTAEPGTSVAIGLDAGAMVAATVDGAGHWTFSYAALADGPHTVQVRSQDDGGNVSPAASVTFSIDATAPVAPVIAAPVDGALTGDNTPVLSGTAEPNTTVTVTLDSIALAPITANGSGDWTLTAAVLADGPHTVSVTATDGFGNVSPASATTTFTVDATMPGAPVITTPAQGSVTNIGRPTFSGTAEDGSTVTLTFPGGATSTVTATGGAWSYTPTADLTPGSNTVQVTATDTAGNISPSSSVTFTYSPVTIITTSLPAGQVGADYTASLTVDGGATPYAFAVTAGALPTGLSLSSGGVISGTPTDSGTFNFTVTVTEGNGLTDDQAYAMTISAPAVPDADPETVVVPATSSTGPTPVDLSGSVQNAASIEIVTPPAQGSVTVNGLTVVYTPQPGFFGTVTFQYKAIGFSDGNGAGAESAPATVTITIAAPTLTLSGGALTAGQIAQAYSTVFAAADGTAPYTYAVTAGALPAGLTLASDGTLSGTPTAGGTFNFTVTATDSSTGTGPFSVSAAYSLTIGAPAMSVTPATLPAATVALAYSQLFAAAGGVAPYTYAITAGALPAGLTLASDGALSGTPTAGGSFNFTVTATDSATGAGPYTASQAITLTVNGSTIAVTPTALAAGTRGVAYSQSVSATGGVAPYTYAVASGALPAGLSLSPQGVITGTPTAVGTFTFGVRATDSATGAGPYQGVATVTLTISAATISVTPTTLPQVLAGTSFSQQMQASGGQGGYTYSLTNSGLPTGLTLSSSGLISGRPQISGVFNFTVTARDGFGNTGAVALSLTVNGRPDPSADADVRALSTAQAEATRRMAGAQLELFNRRLEALHNGSGPGQVDLRLNLDGNAFTPLDSDRATMGELAQATGRPGLDDRDLSGRGELARMMDGRRPDAAEASPQGAPGPANGSVQAGGLRIWAGGAISLGERDATTQTAEFRIHTSGVSAGADMRITDTLDFGLGVGFGQERTKVGEEDSRMDADSWMGLAYGSWRPAESVFVDGVLGYGQMSFDTQRRTPVDSSLVTGTRDGSTWFGSVSAGVDRTFGPARWIGYGRVEALNASLDAYAETGSPIWALSYDARELDSLQGALGLRYERVFAGRDFTWTPGLRLELRREFSEGGAQTLRYADWLDGPAYAIGQEGWGRSEVNLGLTFDFKGANGWSFSTGADTRLSDEQWMASMKLLISKVF